MLITGGKNLRDFITRFIYIYHNGELLRLYIGDLI